MDREMSHSPFSPSFTLKVHVWANGEIIDLWQSPVDNCWSAQARFALLLQTFLFRRPCTSISEINEAICYFHVHCRLMQVFLCLYMLVTFLTPFYSSGSNPFFKGIFTTPFLNSRLLISSSSFPLCEDFLIPHPHSLLLTFLHCVFVADFGQYQCSSPKCKFQHRVLAP